MFKKKDSLPQRKPFSIRSEQITEDVNAVCVGEGEMSKLYMCIDEKSPEHKREFEKVQEFLRGSKELEKDSEALAKQVTEMEAMRADILTEIEKIKEIQNKKWDGSSESNRS